MTKTIEHFLHNILENALTATGHFKCFDTNFIHDFNCEMIQKAKQNKHISELFENFKQCLNLSRCKHYFNLHTSQKSSLKLVIQIWNTFEIIFANETLLVYDAIRKHVKALARSRIENSRLSVVVIHISHGSKLQQFMKFFSSHPHK